MNFPQNKDIYTVSRVNSEVRQVIEGSFPLLWVEGEISGLAKPRSGHMYFSLKDSHAQIRCALFRGTIARLRHRPEEGMQVLLRARLSLYEGRGEFQMIVEHVEPAGEGALRQAFEELKDRLGKEGLFDPINKQALPQYPRAIAIITSAEGAAIHDVISVLQRRYPATKLVIYPSLVQGKEAPEQLRRQIERANQRQLEDLILLTRGGGSFEDLNAFNDENLAYAIASSQIPLVSAVGHEVDFTIADFVADLRAPTPSAAAELIVPDSNELQQTLTSHGNHLSKALQLVLNDYQQQLHKAKAALEKHHPRARLTQQTLAIEEFNHRMERAMQQKLRRSRSQLTPLQIRLGQHNPINKLEQAKSRLQQLDSRLHQQVRQKMDKQQQQFLMLLKTLNTVNPLNTLERGYAVVTDEKHHVILDAEQTNSGDTVNIRFLRGQAKANII